jgi:two-component system nitrate/nitrite response regulator NarL
VRTKVSIAIVGKNEIVREGLSRILVEEGFTVLATSVDVAALQPDLTDAPVFDLIVVDAQSMMDGLAAVRTLHHNFPHARVVILGDDFSVETTSETMSCGADGYLAKQISCKPLARSLELIASGEKVVSTRTVQAMIARDWSKAPNCLVLSMPGDVRLSERERGVLQCLARGDANKLISRELDITEATVKVHVKAIMRKLGVLNRTQAAILAVTRGLVESPIPPGPAHVAAKRETLPGSRANHASPAWRSNGEAPTQNPPS